MKLSTVPPLASRRPVPHGAAQYLLDLITREGLGPGDRLPSERALAATLGISRASVRQALGALESQGLVSVQPGRGNFVASPALLTFGWSFLGSSPRDAYEARICLESYAAGRAALLMDEAELRSLKSSVAALTRAAQAGDIGEMAVQDSLFHDLVIGSCRNPVVAAMYAAVRDMLVQSQKLPMTSRTRLLETATEHAALLDCFEQRDAAGASALMRSHIEAAAARIGITL